MARGLSLSDAALEVGIPLSEAETWADDKESGKDRLAHTLRAAGLSAMQDAMEALRAVIKDPPPIINRHGEDVGPDGDTVVAAATELSRLGRELVKLSRSPQDVGTRKANGGTDLFDAAAQAAALAPSDPWKT